MKSINVTDWRQANVDAGKEPSANPDVAHHTNRRTCSRVAPMVRGRLVGPVENLGVDARYRWPSSPFVSVGGPDIEVAQPRVGFDLRWRT